jgi:hypothetical protein
MATIGYRQHVVAAAELLLRALLHGPHVDGGQSPEIGLCGLLEQQLVLEPLRCLCCRVVRCLSRFSFIKSATLSFNLLWLDYCRTISYVIGPDGRILYSYADSNPVKHVENTLSFVKRWREEHN